MIRRSIPRELALPPYSGEQLTSDTVIYFSENAKFYEAIRTGFNRVAEREVLPSEEALEKEHQLVDAHFEIKDGPNAWHDWFSFRSLGHWFHVHLVWEQGTNVYSQPMDGVAYTTCYITGSVHHRATIVLGNILRKKHIPFECYRIPSTIEEISGCVSLPSVIA